MHPRAYADLMEPVTIHRASLVVPPAWSQTSGIGSIRIFLITMLITASAHAQTPRADEHEFSRADFATRTIDLTEVFSGSPPREDIPPVGKPRKALLGTAAPQ